MLALFFMSLFFFLKVPKQQVLLNCYFNTIFVEFDHRWTVRFRNGLGHLQIALKVRSVGITVP